MFDYIDFDKSIAFENVKIGQEFVALMQGDKWLYRKRDEESAELVDYRSGREFKNEVVWVRNG